MDLEVAFAGFREGAFEVFADGQGRGGKGEELGRKSEKVDAEGLEGGSKGEVEEVREDIEPVKATRWRNEERQRQNEGRMMRPTTS